MNHERWVISYADFITLLFGFFVVMYSISSVNNEKYKELSTSLVAIFQASSNPLNPVALGNKVVTSENYATPIPLPVPGDFPSQEDYKYGIEGLFDDVTPGTSPSGPVNKDPLTFLEQLSEHLAEALQVEIGRGDITVVHRGDWLELSIQSNVLFGSGSALLSPSSREVLQKTATLLQTGDYPIRVEGFTDNLPIDTEQFPSNWELSAARAAAVVRWFVRQGVDASRLAAVGYGEQRPVASNETDAGRMQNRRISIVVSTRGENATRGENGPSTAAVPDKVNYKLGGGSIQSMARSPGSTSSVPLKMMSLENGRMHFSAEPVQRVAQPFPGEPTP